MRSLVKQRLVGALILVALAVVFWPIIFVPGDTRSDDFSVAVPAAPPVDRTPLPEPDNAGLRSPRDARAQGRIVRDVAPPPVPGAAEGAVAATAAGDPGTEQGERPADPDTETDRDDPTVDPAPLPALPDAGETVPVATLDEARERLTEPAVDEDGLPIAFSLQVATMGDRAGAERLRDELIAAGYKGYLKRLRRDDRILYRVLVGPKFQRDDLVPVKAAVDDTWRVDSLIIRYLP